MVTAIIAVKIYGRKIAVIIWTLPQGSGFRNSLFLLGYMRYNRKVILQQKKAQTNCSIPNAVKNKRIKKTT